jgi:extracellular factor (EF) 3-hydroxypalmitic acid methyl ester biosynthesis protein
MQAINQSSVQPFEMLQHLIAQGGPETGEYETLVRLATQLAKDYEDGHIKQLDVQLLQNSFGPQCLHKTLHGHSLTKPYGYAGDFMIIDKIYRQHVTSDHRFAKWDLFWHQLPACQAVRNRKAYFIQTMKNRLAARKHIDLLNVASGPARDLAELYAHIQPGRINTVCLEADEQAIAYARELNKNHDNHIEFIQKNIFRFDTSSRFDMIWSSGLFDYFIDSVFVKILRRFVSWTKPGGEIIIGNFSTDNPSRHFMEFFGDWYLYHRSEEKLVKLALEAGIPRNRISVEKEPVGVNLFLHIKA